MNPNLIYCLLPVVGLTRITIIIIKKTISLREMTNCISSKVQKGIYKRERR